MFEDQALIAFLTYLNGFAESQLEAGAEWFHLKTEVYKANPRPYNICLGSMPRHRKSVQKPPTSKLRLKNLWKRSES